MVGEKGANNPPLISRYLALNSENFDINQNKLINVISLSKGKMLFCVDIHV